MTPGRSNLSDLAGCDSARFDRAAVLARGGAVAAPRHDGWQPVPPPAPDWEIAVRPDLPPAPPHRVATPQAAVTEAIRLSAGRAGCVRITLGPGTHAGPLVLPAGPLRFELCGAGRDLTTLKAEIDAEMPGTDYARRFAAILAQADPASRALYDSICARATLSTGNAAVLRIMAADTVLRDMTLRNSYDCTRASAAEGHALDAQGRYPSGQHQAVALMTDADRVQLRRLRLESFQDTLYLHARPGQIARVALEDCEVLGDVDFIFGQATAHFTGCTLIGRTDRAPNVWITAPATALGAPYGFVFDRCRFAAEDGPVAQAGRIQLGRQWFEGVRASPYRSALDPAFRVALAEASVLEGDTGGTISRATLEAVGKCVILRSEIAPAFNPAAPFGGWNTPPEDRRGQSAAQPPHPRLRPAQPGPAAFLRHLRPWLAAQGLRYDDLPPDDIWLGLFDCTCAGQPIGSLLGPQTATAAL